MQVYVIGPNLRTKDADFHIHKAGCADTKKRVYHDYALIAEEWDTFHNLVANLYADIIAEGEGRYTVESFYGDFKVFDCAKELK